MDRSELQAGDENQRIEEIRWDSLSLAFVLKALRVLQAHVLSRVMDDDRIAGDLGEDGAEIPGLGLAEAVKGCRLK